MTAPPPSLAVAVVHLLPVLVWGIVGWDACRYLAIRRPVSRLFWLLPAVAGFSLMHFGGHALLALMPAQLDGRAYGLRQILECAMVASLVGTIAVLRHMVPLLPVREVPPSARWLAVNYGSAVLVAAVAAALRVSGSTLADRDDADTIVAGTWVLVVGSLALYELRQLARRGAWRPGSFELSSPDVAIMAAVMVAGVGLMIGSLVAGGLMPVHTLPMLTVHTAVGLALAVPFLVRMLGDTIRMLLMIGAATVVTAAVLGAHAAASGLASVEARRLADLGILVAMIAALGPGRDWFGDAVERLVFRRSRHRGAELQAFLDTLPPEAGALECCRRGLAELRRVFQLPGAAILLADGGAVTHGAIDVEPIRRVWPHDGTLPALPPGVPVEPRELPLRLREGLVDADVVWVAAIASSRRHWGHLFATEGFVRGRLVREDVDVVAAFAGQLARVLDGAELLERAVAVERSLAHREKLAAIGELAARVAHEIRNPVTAARSLAQQLAREPGAFAEEHRLILTELERVERQVQALLRFARRDDYRFEPVALDELVAGTVESLRPRLEAAGIAVGLEVVAGTTAHADREKLRQVLVNLMENAIDALAGSADGRRLTIAVAAADGVATMRVTDNGPGVPARVLAQVFEPFFTLKPGGTGLGLAIARRTVEAHGGRIEATAAPGGGFAVTIVLPPRREAA